MNLSRLLSQSNAPRSVISKVIASCGSVNKALTALRTDPFDVLRRAGASADVAERVAILLKFSTQRRALGHAEWLLAVHSLLSRSMLVARLKFAMELPDATINILVSRCLDDGSLVAVNNMVTSAGHYQKNVQMAREMQARGLPSLNERIAHAFKGLLSGKQQDALDMVANHKFSIITGGPGTGKSHVVREMTGAFSQTRVTAPTGRAARNASGKTVHYFKTIQESGKNDFTGIELVIVDEASMLSTELMWAVLQMAPANSHIVLVGDVDQLPPIDAGDVLRDVISSGSVPVTVLDHNARSCQGIQEFAQSILEGAPKKCSNVRYVECETFDQVVNLVVNLPGMVLTPHNATRLVLNKALQLHHWGVLGDVDVVLAKDFPDAPRGSLGVAVFSDGIFDVLADDGVSFQATPAAAVDLITAHDRHGECVQGECIILAGDKVIVTKNNGDLCNGDIGMFLGRKGDKMTIDIDGSTRHFPALSASDPGMTLAYAITVHKAQGSEFDTVILPVTNVASWDRSLLYTAVTRAKENIIILGTFADICTITQSARPPRPSVLRTLFK